MAFFMLWGHGSHAGVRVCYLQWRGLLVDGGQEDHQLVVDAQVAKDVALRHRHVQSQDLQDVVHRHRLVLVKLRAEG